MLQRAGPSVRSAAYLPERMFPRMRQRLGSALRDNLDLLVEFSTLGEYRLMDPCAVAEPAARTPLPTGPTPHAGRRAGCARPAGVPGRRQRAGAPVPPEQDCLSAGETWQYKFPKVGRFPIHSKTNPDVKGVIVVVEKGTGPSTTAAN